MRTTDRTGFDMSYWTNGYLFLSYMWLFHTGLTIFGTFFNRALGSKVGVFPGVTLPFRCQCLRKQLLHLNITCILDSCSSESDTLMMDLLDPSPPSNGKKMLLFVRFLCVCVCAYLVKVVTGCTCSRPMIFSSNNCCGVFFLQYIACTSL